MARYTTTMNEYLNGELERIGFNEFVNDGKLTFFDDEFQFIQKILRFDKDVQEIVTRKIFKNFRFADEMVDKHFKEAFVTRFLDREINRQTIEAFASQVLYVTITHEEYIHTVFSADYMKYIEAHNTTDTLDLSNSIAQELQNQNTTENNKGEEHQKFVGNEVNDTTSEFHEDTTGHEDTKGHEDVKTTGKETSKTEGTAKHREATATLPQSQQNLNLNSDTMAFADSQQGANDKTTSDTTTNTEGTSVSDSTASSDSTGTTDNNSKSHSNTDTTSNTDTDNESLRHSVSDSNRSNNEDTRGTHTGLNKTYDLANLERIFDMKDKIFQEYDKKCFLQIW